MEKKLLIVLSLIVLILITGTIAKFAEEKSIIDYLEDLNSKIITEPVKEVVTTSQTPTTDSTGNLEEQVERSLVTRLNTLRTTLGVSELSAVDSLSTLARSHSKYQYDMGSLTHVGAGGDIGSRVSAAGWTYNMTGENVGYCSGYYGSEEIASCLMSGWVGSQGHYTNMKNLSYTKVGIGVYGDNGTYYATQIFVG